MKNGKYIIVISVVVATFLIALFLFYSSSMTLSQSGETVESRKNLLVQNSGLKEKGKDWSIASETTMDGFIASGAYSSDNLTTIGIFLPTKNGKYEYYSRTPINTKGDILIDGVVVDKKTYYLIWLYGKPSAYAEVSFKFKQNGEIHETLRFSTENMEVICFEAPGSYDVMRVAYFDANGNEVK